MHIRNLLLLIAFSAILINQCSAGIKTQKREPSNEEEGNEDHNEPSEENRKEERRRERPVKKEKKQEEKKRQSDERESGSEEKKKFVWSYRKNNGPSVWPQYFPAGRGKEQSPINIETKSLSVGFDRLLTPLKFNYKVADTFTIKNNDRGFIIEFNDKYDSTVSGGPLANEYQLRRIIPHWGKNESRGSEHLINGQAYPSEFQFVHYNKIKYGTFDEASTHGDGLAIVSVFFKLGSQSNNAISVFLKYLPKIVKPFTEAKVKREVFPVASLLPHEYEKFWTYSGSLTQPPLTENSIWIILQNTVDYGKHQLKLFRDFRKYYPTNLRPVQSLNDRVIRASFHEKHADKQEEPRHHEKEE